MEFVLTKSVQEKLEELFLKKCLLLTEGSNKNKWQKWVDYLDGLEGVQYIRKFSNLAEPFEYLIEEINQNLPFDKFIICENVWKGNFIIVEKEVAEKILALGYLP
jgi:hypothetical protein